MPKGNVVEPAGTDVKQAEYLEIKIIKASPLVEAALKFYAMRNGISVEDYCCEAIRLALQGDEDQSMSCFTEIGALLAVL